tara:strand:- start:2135 stop:2812 length:678 start_codon:yes stop_codon:yes gene_type:complete
MTRQITQKDPTDLQTPWRPGINGMFSLPIFMNQAVDDQFDNIHNELNTVADKIDFAQKNGWNADTHMLSPDPFERNIIEEYKCKYFLEFLEQSIFNYVAPILKHDGFDYCLNGAWMTKTINGKYAQEHSHGTADISGVYYVDTTGEDGNLFFDNIHSHACSNALVANLKAKEIMPLENGLIMLWPGYLKHGTFVNQSDHPRISMSFNIVLSRAGFSKDIISRSRL